MLVRQAYQDRAADYDRSVTCGQVVARACTALKPGGRFVVLDMAWPSYMPLWFRHFLPFLRTYGVDKAVLERRAWETVHRTMVDTLTGISLKKYCFQFFYRCSGVMDQTAG